MVEITAKEILPLIKGPIDKLFASIGSEFKQIISNRLIEYQSETYKRNLYSKTFLNRSEAKKLDDFYEPLYIEPQQDELDKSKIKNIRISTARIENIFKLSKRIVIIGSAGSGKTTLTKHLFVQCIQSGFKFPIKIELRYLNEYSKENIYDYIVEEIFTFHKLGISRDSVNNLISKDSFVFFFDGFDELSTPLRIRVARQIEEFTQRFPDNIYVVTSRPHTDVEYLPLFKNYFVSNLKKKEINSFIKKQLPKDEEELANKIIDAINKSGGEMYSEYVKIPLLLAMFILTFQSYPDVPQERSAFYEQVFDTLFSIHDSTSKLAYTRKRRTNLTKKQFEELLRTFALLSFFGNRPSFNLKYFNETLDAIKNKNSTLNFDNDALIEDLIVSVSIITKEGYNYSFPHRSLQEFFAATYIQKLENNAKTKIYSKIMNNIFKDILEIAANANFFHLLYEVDKVNLIKNLTLPLMIESAKLANSVDFFTQSFHYFRAYLIISFTIKLEDISGNLLQCFENLLLSRYYLPSVLSDSKKALSSRIESNDQDSINSMKEGIEKFKKSSQAIIIYLNKIAASEDEVNDNIIDLI